MKNKEKMKSQIGENLKIARLKKKFSQESLAKQSGVTLHTISKIEAGATGDPRVLTLEKLVKALNIKIDDLLK